ncbi:hypothetical protein [Entomomonas asaccharolytica]|uniref:Uncharacterized protein n=1 Tax=Entomomonas asaccharolytica TaxID=2785331 RepID=A0A974RWD1_9GAMM|nr:hypothetical protein [Entomomonas asaccharolytica]QQP85055.1 hypothetical protein JHT90_11760 [Entomomonas asaccharolytica]
MGLDHEFILLDKKNYPLDMSFKAMLKTYDTIRRGAVTLDDDLIWYMRDTLLWIPAYSEGDNTGLNLYGITKITKNQAKYLQNIVDSWLALFSIAPEEELNLTGCWVTDEESEDGGYYEKLIYKKDYILQKLKAISEMSEVVTLDEGFYILHFGI